MSDEIKEGAPETTPAEIEAPADYREYDHWRRTGELPKKEDQAPPAAAEETPPAKSVPQSGAEETQPAEEEEEPEPGKPGRGGSRQRKIDRLTRDNEWLKAQLAAVNQAKLTHAPPEAEPPKPAEPPGKPKLHDFPTLEAYQEALTDWKLDQREAQKKAEAIQAEARTAEEKLQTEWSSKTEAARGNHPDYDEVVQATPYPVGPGVMPARQALLEDEAGAEILYHLATHPDELQRIAQMQPVSAIREIGKLSAMFAQTSTAGNPKPKVSGAPKPPPPLSRPSPGSTKRDIHDEHFARTDFSGWEKERVRQLKG
ncbi:MAG TPA: hypothetical protein VKB88_21600 [Bryobacteraceae bacterium]|nr:hypothetical protein [Bryobacteraceae bacterium]